MANEPESVHFALKKVDLSKQLIIFIIVAVLVAILFAFGSLMAAARIEDAGRSKLLFMSVAAQMAFVGVCAALLAFHISRMTKAVLKAIELASKK